MRTGQNPLSGIEPTDVIRSHDSLAGLSDFELVRAAAEIIARPRREFSSFGMHAPLELLARFSLLPRVAPEDRRLARIQILATTALYESGGATVGEARETGVPTDSASTIAASLRQGIRAGDVQGSDELFTALAERFGAIEVVGSVADLALRTLTAGAHTHIGLMLLARSWPEAGPELRKLPRAGVRALAGDPELTLKPTTGPGRLANLEQALARVPRIEASRLDIGGTVQAAEEAGLVDEVLGDALDTDSGATSCEGVLRTACRIAALSMVADSRDSSPLDEFVADRLATPKYGWAHCLTLPQAAWALARLYPDPSFQSEAARSAATWVIAFRATYGDGDLETEPEMPPVRMDLEDALYDSPEAAASVAWHAGPRERDRLVRVLATEAAIRIDAHLIKHTRACLDAATLDPDRAHLYHAAAARLCSIWCREEPRQMSAERLAASREH